MEIEEEKYPLAVLLNIVTSVSFCATITAFLDVAKLIPAPLMRVVAGSGLTERQLLRQRIAAFEDAAKLITIPAPFGFAFMVDSSIIFTLAPLLKVLVRELDMVKNWPAECNDLRLRGFSVNAVSHRDSQRSVNLVSPAPAMQLAAVHSCLSALLQQRQAARDAMCISKKYLFHRG